MLRLTTYGMMGYFLIHPNSLKPLTLCAMWWLITFVGRELGTGLCMRPSINIFVQMVLLNVPEMWSCASFLEVFILAQNQNMPASCNSYTIFFCAFIVANWSIFCGKTEVPCSREWTSHKFCTFLWNSNGWTTPVTLVTNYTLSAKIILSFAL